MKYTCAWCKKINPCSFRLGDRDFCSDDCMMAFWIWVGIEVSGTEFEKTREEIMVDVKEWKKSNKRDYFARIYNED